MTVTENNKDKQNKTDIFNKILLSSMFLMLVGGVLFITPPEQRHDVILFFIASATTILGVLAGIMQGPAQKHTQQENTITGGSSVDIGAPSDTTILKDKDVK